MEVFGNPLKSPLFMGFAGAVLGAVGGVLVAMAIGYISIWQHPNDPSAGSVSIVGMATFPLGLIYGAKIGVAISKKHCLETIEGSRCSQCGYDLRATPDRCPECGTVFQRDV